MRTYLYKLSRWIIPPSPPEEKMTALERLLLLWLFLLALGLFLYLTGILSVRLGLGNISLSGHLGFYCPACGGTRALNLLLQGQLLSAWHHNQLFILSLPLIFYGGFHLLRSLVTGYPLTRIYISPNWLWLLLATAVLFTLLRNIPLPALDFLRPPSL